MSHSDVFVNVRRTLVPLVAIRTLKSRLLPAIVLHMRPQRFLISVARVTYRTMIGHFAKIPADAVFILHGRSSLLLLHVCP